MAGGSRPRQAGAANAGALEADLHFGEPRSGTAPKPRSSLEDPARLRALVAHAPDPILEVDAGGTVLFASRPLPGAPARIEGSSFFDLFAPQFRASARTVFDAALRS